MRILAFLLLLSRSLLASSDPLVARLADPLEPGRPIEISLGLRQYQRDVWLDDQMRPSWLLGSDGNARAIKGFRFELRGLVQAGERSVFEINVPYYFQEYSRLSTEIRPPSLLNDTSVNRGDGLGDIRLGWIFTWLRTEHLSGGLNLEMMTPTGEGPYASSSPFVATGQGSFGFAPALELSAHNTSWETWLQCRLPFDLGTVVDTAGKRVFVRRDPSLELNWGLRWTWFQEEPARHSLALEISRNVGGSQVVDGLAVPDSWTTSWDLVPQARFAFAHGFTFLFGWELPLWLATNQPAAYWGEPIFRADYPL